MVCSLYLAYVLIWDDIFRGRVARCVTAVSSSSRLVTSSQDGWRGGSLS